MAERHSGLDPESPD